MRERLAAGRSMAALKEAKELAKRAPGPESDALLAAAYRARIADLANQRLHREAHELLAIAAARFPEAGDEWQRAALQLTRAEGNLDDLLLQWRDAPEAERSATAAALAAELRDLQPILASTVLAADDPLRAAARGLAAAFEAVAAGKADAASRSVLREELPAPLRPWQAFVRALDAFHRHDDAAARAELAAVPDDAGIARGKRILLDLMGARPLRDDLPAVRSLAARLTAGASVLYRPAAILAGDAEARVRREAARTVLVGLAAHRPRAAARLVWTLRGLPDYDPLVDELDRKLGVELFGHAEWTRLTADLDAEEDPIVGITAWLTWLMPLKSDELRRLSPVELAELLTHLTGIAMPAGEAIADRIGADVADALGDREMLDAALEPVLDEESLSEDQDRAVTAAYLIGDALARLRDHTGVQPWFRDARQFLEHAIALDPIADRFWLAVRLTDEDEVDARRALLDAWIRAVPEDSEPWVLLGAEARRRGDVPHAQECLQRATERAPSDPRVLSLRFALRFDELRQPARDGEVSVCRLMLDELKSDPAAQGPVPRALLAAAAVVAAGDEPAAAVAAIGDAERAQVAIDFVREELLGPEAAASGEEGDEPEWRSVRQRFARAAWLARLAEALEADPDIDLPEGRGSPSDMPDDDEDRNALCRLGEEREDYDLVLLASGRGLLRDGPRLARFLFHRGRAVERVHDEIDAGEDLLAAAKWFAIRDGDVETRRMVDALRRPLSRDVDGETAADILAEERKLERGTRKAVATHARPSFRRHPPRTGEAAEGSAP